MRIGPNLSWRFVYNDTILVTYPFQSDGWTESIHTIEERETEEECWARINELGLDYDVNKIDFQN